jgi:hypothetical protein
MAFRAAEANKPGDRLYVGLGASQSMACYRLETIAAANRAALGKSYLLGHRTPASAGRIRCGSLIDEQLS